MKKVGSPPAGRIEDRQGALDQYLDTLLCEPEMQSAPEPDSAAEPPPRSVESCPQTTRDQARSETGRAKPAAVEPALTPAWKADPLTLLHFRVGEWRLACPLSQIVRTSEYSGGAASVPGQADWIEGVISDQNQRITLLRTGLILDRRRSMNIPAAGESYPLIIRADRSGRWGLLCDEIVRLGSISAQNIRWRHRRREPNWYTGTVMDELSLLIDLPALLDGKI